MNPPIKSKIIRQPTKEEMQLTEEQKEALSELFEWEKSSQESNFILGVHSSEYKDDDIKRAASKIVDKLKTEPHLKKERI